jgi:UNC-50 family
MSNNRDLTESKTTVAETATTKMTSSTSTTTQSSTSKPLFSSSSSLPPYSGNNSNRIKFRLTIPSGADSSRIISSGGSIGSHRSVASAHWSRWTDVSQMDWQSALDQMRCLLSVRPYVVYKTAYYRKQTKNHWARDDPAFVVLQVLLLTVTSMAYSIAFRTSILGGLSFLVSSLWWNWLFPGLLIATLGREFANRQLISTPLSTSHVQQSVEWLYAFDIHCNAYFPLFCMLCK